MLSKKLILRFIFLSKESIFKQKNNSNIDGASLEDIKVLFIAFVVVLVEPSFMSSSSSVDGCRSFDQNVHYTNAIKTQCKDITIHYYML